jgi:hypothetical protein
VTIPQVSRPKARALELCDVRLGKTELEGIGGADVLPGLRTGKERDQRVRREKAEPRRTAKPRRHVNISPRLEKTSLSHDPCQHVRSIEASSNRCFRSIPNLPPIIEVSQSLKARDAIGAAHTSPSGLDIEGPATRVTRGGAERMRPENNGWTQPSSIFQHRSIARCYLRRSTGAE